MLNTVLSAQSANGAFPSTVHVGNHQYQDYNGFVTAQVVRALNNTPDSLPLNNTKERALDFLQKCELVNQPGVFGFWPEENRPSWARYLPADTDDTAIILLEMVKCGRIEQKKIKEIVCNVLISHRLRFIQEPAPPWIHKGVFLTWLGKGNRQNIIDCCVNANVVALMSYASLQHLPGYREACDMIEDGITWAGDELKRVHTLTPFYPHPVEFILAVKNAIQCGVKKLERSLFMMEKARWIKDCSSDEQQIQRSVCGSAYGKIYWTSSVLHMARKLAL